MCPTERSIKRWFQALMFRGHYKSECFFFNHPSQVFGEGNNTPLQYSCLENPMDGGAWRASVHGVAGSRTRLSDFMLFFHFHALEKEMATYSSVLAWRIPGMGEPGGLPSMGSHRVRYDWSNLAAAAAAAAVRYYCFGLYLYYVSLSKCSKLRSEREKSDQ